MATNTAASARPEFDPTRVTCDCLHDAIEALNTMHDELGMDAVLMMGGDASRASRMSAAQWDERAPGRGLVSSDEITEALPWSWDEALALAFTARCVRTLGFLRMYVKDAFEINHVSGCPKGTAGQGFGLN